MKRTGSSFSFTFAIIACAGMLVMGGQAAAAELKLSHSHQPDMSSEIQTAAWVFKSWVNELSDTLDVKIYAANELGEERAVYEGIQLGGGASCVISGTTILNNFNKKIGVVDLPFLWKSYDHIHRAFDGPLGETLEQELDGIGLKVVGWLDSWGWRNVVTSKKRVTTAEDLKGLKIRTIQSPIYVAAVNAMGANATPMAFGEVYTGMETGVLDGFEHGSAVIRAMKFYEVSKYIAKTEHLISPLVFACSKKEWESWSDSDKAVVTYAAQLAQDVNRALAPQREAEAFQFLKDQGMEINDIDKTPFQEAALGLQDELAAQMQAQDLLQLIRDAE